MAEHTLIINTTPLGMYPNVDEAPAIPYGCLGDSHYLYDLVYNPAKTLFLKRGEEKGAVTENGADMLVIQAEASWDIWNS
jgi:shikimate dehydrogenase